MDYRNTIKNKETKQKLINGVKNVTKDVSSFIKDEVTPFIKEKANEVNTVYSNKKEDFLRKNIFANVISTVESCIVASASDDKVLVISKYNNEEDTESLAISNLVNNLPINISEDYVDVLFEVVKIHFSEEPQLDVVVNIKNNELRISVKEAPIEEPVEEPVKAPAQEESEINLQMDK